MSPPTDRGAQGGTRETLNRIVPGFCQSNTANRAARPTNCGYSVMGRVSGLRTKVNPA